MAKAFKLFRLVGLVDDAADGVRAVDKSADAAGGIADGARAADAATDAAGGAADTQKSMGFGTKVLVGLGLVGGGVAANESVGAATGTRATEGLSLGIGNIGDDIDSALSSLLYDVIIPGLLIFIIIKIATK